MKIDNESSIKFKSISLVYNFLGRYHTIVHRVHSIPIVYLYYIQCIIYNSHSTYAYVIF